MSIIAGVDIGNATTEIVLVDAAHYPPTPIAWDRAPTQGRKGSVQAASAAARLLRRVERRLHVEQPGRRVEAVAVTRQVAVHTAAHPVHLPAADTGRMVVLGRALPTPAGNGLGVGRPVPIDDEPILGHPVVLVAADRLGYRATIQRVQHWSAAGADVQALLLAGDEAHIVGLGLAAAAVHAPPGAVNEALPILDRIDPATALACCRIAVEVRAGPLQQLSDALWLRAHLGLDTDDTVDLPVVTNLMRGARSGAVGILDQPVPRRQVQSPAGALHLADGSQIPLVGSSQILSSLPVGTVRGVTMDGVQARCDDAWVVETGALVAHRPAHQQIDHADEQIALSTLLPAPMDGSAEEEFSCFADHWQVRVVENEAQAAYAGACTTPGTDERTIVVDLGGGTVDLIRPSDPRGGLPESITAAGCGQLLTTTTAAVLGISGAMAEWIKRGPAQRVEAPHLLATEDGQRQFTDAPLPAHSMGWLTAPGPAGVLPFTPALTLGEWRQLRLALKEAVIGRNLSRLLHAHPTEPTPVVLVGGPAGDDELFESLVRQLPWALLGRGNVAGRLGYRWAVAYGLTLLGYR